MYRKFNKKEHFKMDEKFLKFEWKCMLLCALEVPHYCFDFFFF